MAMDLAELAEPEAGDLDWDDRASLADLSHVNDLAYGDEPGTFALGLGRPREGAWRLYQARLDGEPASVVGTIDHDGDCGIYFVATLPAAQGRGLARRLLHLALAAARDRGCTTTTLQATRIGRAVYERIGYRDLGVLEMWEHRS
jgi:ribosomal protein S18 acetylase RimI-like enzyme